MGSIGPAQQAQLMQVLGKSADAPAGNPAQVYGGPQSFALGGGGTWSPTDIQQVGLNGAINASNANGIAVPPSNFARWSAYTGNNAINTKAPPLQPMGGGGGSGVPGGNAGGGSGGDLGYGHFPAGNNPPPSIYGPLSPGGNVPGTGIPNGGFTNPTGNPANQSLGALNDFYKGNVGNANLSNGQYSMDKFRFSDQNAQGNPQLAQFNALMNAGKTGDAYRSLFQNGGGGVGAQAFEAAFGAGNNPQLQGQIINSFSNGGNQVGGAAVQHRSDAYTPTGYWNAQGQWQAPTARDMANAGRTHGGKK